MITNISKLKGLQALILVTFFLFFRFNILFANNDTEKPIKPVWKVGDWWIIEVRYAQVLRPTRDLTWGKLNELKLEIKKGNHEYKDCEWIIQMTEVNHYCVGEEIDKVEAYYDREFNFLGVKGYNSKKNTVIWIRETKDDNLLPIYYSKGFFIIPNDSKKWVIKEEKVDLSGKVEKVSKTEISYPYNHNLHDYQYWKKNKPWWVYFETVTPITPTLKCKVLKWSGEGEN